MKAKLITFVRGLSNGTPPRFQSYLKSLSLILTLLLSTNVWGADPVVLFHETFGCNDSGSARDWDDSYSVKSGVSDVYSGISSYTLSNARQSKCTAGDDGSTLYEKTQNEDASIIIGPLAVSNYTSLSVSYSWKAGSTGGTYYAKLYYKTSSGASFTEVTGTGAGATTFITRLHSLPEAAQVNTLYLKIVWMTSNTQGHIDEVELTGISSGPACTTDLTTPVVTATAGNGSATLAWGAVEHTTSYTVTCVGATIGSITGEGTKTCTLTGLTNGTEYTWKVKAIGGDIYCDSKEATGNVTPSANHTVAWYVDGEVYTEGSPTTEVADGGKVTTLPTQPKVPDACHGSVFVGWTDQAIYIGTGTKPDVLFKDAEHAPEVNKNVIYHAVFADPE